MKNPIPTTSIDTSGPDFHPEIIQNMTTSTKQKAPEYDDTVVESRGPSRGKSYLPIPRSEQAKASSALARVNIPINLQNWRDRTPEHQEELIWYHQHILDQNLTWNQVVKTLPKGGKGGGTYDKTVIFRVLKGDYEGSWDNIIDAIRSYRTLWEARRQLKQSTFARNTISDLIWSGLDYAFTASGITEIIGESGQGKSCCAREWHHRNNHGKTVMVEAPTFGGSKALLRAICAAIGSNKNNTVPVMCENIFRAFNPNRILIIDEAHRLLPSESRIAPKTIDFLREIHDRTGCALALIVTARFDDTLRHNAYMFEQILGRIDMPVRLPRTMEAGAWMPLLVQYVPEPSETLSRLCSEIVNTALGGRMRKLDKLLKFASRIASMDEEPLSEKHVLKAVKLHERMMGETSFATRK